MNNNKQAQEAPLMEVLEDLEASRDLKVSRIHLGKGKQGKVKTHLETYLKNSKNFLEVEARDRKEEVLNKLKKGKDIQVTSDFKFFLDLN